MAINAKNLILGAKAPVPIDRSLQGAQPVVDKAAPAQEGGGIYPLPPVNGNEPKTFNAATNVTSPDTSNPTPSSTTSSFSGPDWERIRGMNNKQIFDFLQNEAKRYAPPSAEEVEKEHKRQKRRALFAAIGDGVSALSNLYFTTRGAPSTNIDPRDTLSARAQERYDKFKKEREENRDRYYNILAQQNSIANHEIQTRQNAEQAKIENDRWERDFDLRERQQKRLEEEAKAKIALYDARNNLLAAQANKNEAEAAYWGAKLDALERGLPLDLALKEAKIAKEKALAGKANRTGGKSQGNDGTETVTEKTTNRGSGKVTTVKYHRPRIKSTGVKWK